MIDFKKDNYAKNLPDAFRKDTDSNNYKILENERIAVEEHLNDLYGIYEIINLDNAYGKTLDRYGERVGQPRGLATDEQYILMIKAKIMRALGNGTYPSVLTSLCATFGCEPESVYIEETEEPCNVGNVVLPIDVLNADITADFIIDIVKNLLPVCVSIDSISVVGVDSRIEIRLDIRHYESNYPLCGTFLCGTYPYVTTAGKTAESNVNVGTELSRGNSVYYLCGCIYCGGEVID